MSIIRKAKTSGLGLGLAAAFALLPPSPLLKLKGPCFSGNGPERAVASQQAGAGPIKAEGGLSGHSYQAGLPGSLSGGAGSLSRQSTCLPGPGPRPWPEGASSPRRLRLATLCPKNLGYLITCRVTRQRPAGSPPAQPVAAYGTRCQLEGFWLRISLACRLRHVRPARRPWAHSV